MNKGKRGKVVIKGGRKIDGEGGRKIIYGTKIRIYKREKLCKHCSPTKHMLLPQFQVWSGTVLNAP